MIVRRFFLLIAIPAAFTAHPLMAESYSLAKANSARISDISFNLHDSGTQGPITLRHVQHVQPVQAKPRSFEIHDGTGATTHLKHLIAWAEAGHKGYDAIQLGAKKLPAKRPTQMTIGEIYAWINQTPNQPHAIGRYQFIPSTLQSLVIQAGISESHKFTTGVQDALADILLEDAGISSFMEGKISRHRFMTNLAKIWAGFPTATGRSHYHGYAGNRAVISWDRFDAIMKKIFPTKRG